MKSSINTRFSAVRKSIFLPAIVSVFFAITAPAYAQAQDKSKATPVEIKYLGLVNNQPVLQVEFSNPEEEDLYITLKGADGTLLYSERFKDKKYSKKFQIEKDDMEPALTVSVQSRRDRQAQVLQISNNTRTVEDVVITKVQ